MQAGIPIGATLPPSLKAKEAFLTRRLFDLVIKTTITNGAGAERQEPVLLPYLNNPQVFPPIIFLINQNSFGANFFSIFTA
jgi:hypothetical protein